MFDNAPTPHRRHMSAGIRIRAITIHVWQKLLTNTIGRAFISTVGKRLRRDLATIGEPARRPDVRVAFVAHVYYLDLIDDILEMRRIFPEPAPMHVTVPADRLDELRHRIRAEPAITLHPCENRGRDIAPFLAVLQSGALDGYDAVLKLHTKRSPHLIDGEVRRKLLFAMLCGERNATWRALAAFEDPATGMVGWRDSFRSATPYWMENEATVRAISVRMKAEEAVRIGFFEGSMFWFRPSAFAALRELDLQPHDFEPEARQLDRTLHHAIERCFTIAAWARGFVVRDLRGRELP